MMNKILSSLALSILLLLPTSCTTTATGTHQVDPAIADKVAPVLTSAVAGAVVYAYTKDPNSEKYLSVLKVALQEFLVSDDLSAVALQVKIYSLPIKELKTAEAQLLIAPLLGAYRAVADPIVKTKTKNDPGLQRLVTALIAGLDEGLNAVATIKSSGSTSIRQEQWREFASLDHVIKAMVREIEDWTYPYGG